MLGPNKQRFNRDNISFNTFITMIKKYNPTVNQFEREWDNLGLNTGNATVEWSVESASLEALVPKVTVGRVITKVSATVRLTFVETDVENISKILFQQTPTFVNNTNITNQTYTGINTSDFITVPSLSPNPIYILNSIPDLTGTFQVLDSSSTNVTNDFALRIRKGVAFVERTAAAFPGTPPYDITIQRYTSIRKDRLVVFQDISKVGFPYKMLLIGKNVVNGELTAIYLPSLVVETPPTIGMFSEDFQKLEVSFQTLAEFPNTSPLDPTFSPQYLIIDTYEPNTNPEIIAAQFNFEAIQNIPS